MKKKVKILLILVVIVFIVLAVAKIIYQRNKEEEHQKYVESHTTIPSIVGMTMTEAKEELDKNNLQLKPVAYKSSSLNGSTEDDAIVIQQSPSKGEEVLKNSIVLAYGYKK